MRVGAGHEGNITQSLPSWSTPGGGGAGRRWRAVGAWELVVRTRVVLMLHHLFTAGSRHQDDTTGNGCKDSCDAEASKQDSTGTSQMDYWQQLVEP